MKTNKVLNVLLPLLCLQLVFSDTLMDDKDNMYSNENFKKQLDVSFKKYFNDNIYKIKESSREKRFFNKRQDASNEYEDDNDVNYQDLSCDSEYISELKNCSSGGFECFKSLSSEQFNAYIKCTTKSNSETPNYGELINAIVLNTLSNIEATSIESIIIDVYNKIKFVAEKNNSPYTTDAFIGEMENKFYEDENSGDQRLMSTSYLSCLNLVDKEIYDYETASVCLCSYGYDGDIVGYDKDLKLQALYEYYGFTKESFVNTCRRVLDSSEVFNNENAFISNLDSQKLLKLLKVYNIPNFGTVFNAMAINKLRANTDSSINLKDAVYDLYKKIGDISVQSYEVNDDATEFGRCVVQARNKIVDNSGMSYCLCNAGFSKFPKLTELYNKYGLNQDNYETLCSTVKKERRDKLGCRLGNSVKSCIEKFGTRVETLKKNYTQSEGLDIGVNKSYLLQTKYLCDMYGAKWKNNEFLSCYGYTELSFMLGCRQFYPNQMFSNNPARGMENFYSENYDEECGDSGTGGGHYAHDPCVCNARKERQEVSLEVDDICSRVGTKAPGSCSAGILSIKFSSTLMLLTIVISLFMFI